MGKKKPSTRGQEPSPKQLRAMVQEATVDCYDDLEERLGLCTTIQDNLTVPFETTVLGVRVTVENVEMNACDEIVAICSRGEHRQAIPVVDLPLPSPPPEGAEWIAAYRYWKKGE